ncbi:ECA1 gametoproteinsis family protein [Hirschfeldia incana]|nr:ECA1 gametoproteinsis family protein [Hirschfeldia incana]
MSIKNVHFLLVTICIASSANAQFPFPFQPSPGMPGFPFPNPFQPSPGGMPGIPGISQCWSTLMDMPGCFAEIRQSIVTGKFGSIGPACCKALLDAEANCTQNLPFKPFFPPMLKEQCSRVAGPPMTL